MSQIEILDIVVGKAMTRGWSRCQFIQLLRGYVSQAQDIYLWHNIRAIFFVDKILVDKKFLDFPYHVPKF